MTIQNNIIPFKLQTDIRSDEKQDFLQIGTELLLYQIS